MFITAQGQLVWLLSCLCLWLETSTSGRCRNIDWTVWASLTRVRGQHCSWHKRSLVVAFTRWQLTHFHSNWKKSIRWPWDAFTSTLGCFSAVLSYSTQEKLRTKHFECFFSPHIWCFDSLTYTFQCILAATISKAAYGFVYVCLISIMQK